MSVLELDSGYMAKYGLSPRELPRAGLSGTPLDSGHISPYIPPLVLIRIQYGGGSYPVILGLVTCSPPHMGAMLGTSVIGSHHQPSSSPTVWKVHIRAKLGHTGLYLTAWNYGETSRLASVEVRTRVDLSLPPICPKCLFYSILIKISCHYV